MRLAQFCLSFLQYLAIFYGLFFILFYFLADNIIFQPPPASYHDNERIIKIPISEDKSISAVYLKNPNAKYTILFSHGNAEDLGSLDPFLREIQTNDFNVMAYDYEGYGTSDNKPTENNTYRDIKAAYQYLIQQGVLPHHIIAYGRSLGTGPSIHLASQVPLKALILQSPFVSAYRVQTTIKIFPFDKYPNLSTISQLKVPLLVIHGTNDNVVPLWHGQKIVQAAKGFKQSYWVNGADHNNLVIIADKQLWQEIDSFIQQLDKVKNTHEDPLSLR